MAATALAAFLYLALALPCNAEGGESSARVGFVFGLPQMAGVTLETPQAQTYRFQASVGAIPTLSLTARAVAARVAGSVRPYAFAGGGVLYAPAHLELEAGSGLLSFLWTGAGLRIPIRSAELFAELGVIGSVEQDDRVGAGAVGLMLPVSNGESEQ